MKRRIGEPGAAGSGRRVDRCRVTIPRSVPRVQATGTESAAATWSRGVLHLIEALDPEDKVLAASERRVTADDPKRSWQADIKLAKPLPLADLVWQRVRYRFPYRERDDASFEAAESISQILRTPVVHVVGQHSYLTGGQAAVRVIATDSKNETIAGPSSVRIELGTPEQKSRASIFSARICKLSRKRPPDGKAASSRNSA